MRLAPIHRVACWTAALLACGCGSLDLNLAGRQRTDELAVKEIVCLWEAAEGVGLDGLPTRGFAGQLLFFKPGSDVPVRVEGDVRIYVFYDQGTVDEQSRPLHQFDFPSAAWQTFARDTNLGPAYQIFVPYTRKGRNYAECAVRVRLTANDQLPVYSKLASIALPGRKSIDDTPLAAGDVEGAVPETAAAEAISGGGESLALPVSASLELERLRRAAAGAVQNADYAEDEAAVSDDETSGAVASRRYRMSGTIQQASAVAE
jgi:hypothetical protein